MRRTSGNNAVCFKNLEQEISEYPEKYGCIKILCAGWPCQDNSIAGKRAGHQGERSGLWSELKRNIGLFYPEWIILENVPGLFSVNKGQDFKNVLTDLDSMSYCVAVKVLDSQYFGVAQRRKRVFIVGSFGNIGASKVFLEQKSSNWDFKKKQKKGDRGLCVLARSGETNNPTNDTIVASTIRANEQNCGHRGFEKANLIAFTVGTTDFTGQTGTGNRNIVANTLNKGDRGTSVVWEDNYIAETNPNRERKTSRTPKGLDTRRGIVIGNAVTVPVVEWIAKRIMEIDKEA